MGHTLVEISQGGRVGIEKIDKSPITSPNRGGEGEGKTGGGARRESGTKAAEGAVSARKQGCPPGSENAERSRGRVESFGNGFQDVASSTA